MEIDWTRQDGRCVKSVYFPKNVSLCDIEKYVADGVDELQVWYPSNITKDIYSHYGEGLVYIGLDGGEGIKEYSLRVDLSQNAEAIFSGMHGNRKYEIRRGKSRDPLEIEISKVDDDKMMHTYLEFQNSGKNAHVVDGNLVRAAIKRGCFYIGICKTENKEILALHAWLTNWQQKIVIFFSGKTNYNSVAIKQYGSRPVSLLHYEAMLFFKRLGYMVYDFGGYYISEEENERNRKLLSISRFKESFGGEVVSFESGFVVPFKEIKQISHAIQQLSLLLRNKEVVLWGMGNRGQFALKLLNKLSIYPRYFIDNTLFKQNKAYKTQNILCDLSPEDTIVLVATSYSTYLKIMREDICKRYVKSSHLYCLLEKEVN